MLDIFNIVVQTNVLFEMFEYLVSVARARAHTHTYIYTHTHQCVGVCACVRARMFSGNRLV